MSKTALLIGLITWAGGVIAWFVAALFEYLLRLARYREKKAEIQGACNQDADYAQTIGDINASMANMGFPKPGFFHCTYFSAYQPLLILAIIAIPTFRVWDFGGWIALCVNVGAMVVVLLLTMFHEFQGKTDYIDNDWYRRFVWICWVLYLLLILWLAHVSEDAASKEKSERQTTTISRSTDPIAKLSIRGNPRKPISGFPIDTM